MKSLKLFLSIIFKIVVTNVSAADVTLEMLNKLGKETMVFSEKVVKINVGDTVFWKATDKGHNVEFIKGGTPEGVGKFKSKYNVDTDLHLNPLEVLPENQKILILENNTLYDFKLKDLLSCWKIALLSSQGLFSKPFALKNPYTNIPFKINNLYNIYYSYRI